MITNKRTMKEVIVNDKPYKSLLKRVMASIDEITPRVMVELELIRVNGWAPFFLTLTQFRHVEGNIAGSFIAYKLGITDINPLKYHLNFKGIKSNIPNTTDLRIRISKIDPYLDIIQKAKRYRRMVLISELPLVFALSPDNIKNHIEIRNLPNLKFEVVGDSKILYADSSVLTMEFNFCPEQKIAATVIAGMEVNMYDYDDDDELTYELLSAGNTIGINELEGITMRKVLRKIRPQNFEEVVALYILYHTKRKCEMEALAQIKNENESDYQSKLKEIFESVDKPYYASMCYTAFGYAGLKAIEYNRFLKAAIHIKKGVELRNVLAECDNKGIRTTYLRLKPLENAEKLKEKQ